MAYGRQHNYGEIRSWTVDSKGRQHNYGEIRSWTVDTKGRQHNYGMIVSWLDTAAPVVDSGSTGPLQGDAIRERPALQGASIRNRPWLR